MKIKDFAAEKQLSKQAIYKAIQRAGFSAKQLTDRNGKEKAHYTRNSAMCMEPHHCPDAVNKPQFPSAILHPGDTYYHHTEFRFE